MHSRPSMMALPSIGLLAERGGGPSTHSTPSFSPCLPRPLPPSTNSLPRRRPASARGTCAAPGRPWRRRGWRRRWRRTRPRQRWRAEGCCSGFLLLLLTTATTTTTEPWSSGQRRPFATLDARGERRKRKGGEGERAKERERVETPVLRVNGWGRFATFFFFVFFFHRFFHLFFNHLAVFSLSLSASYPLLVLVHLRRLHPVYEAGKLAPVDPAQKALCPFHEPARRGARKSVSSAFSSAFSVSASASSAPSASASASASAEPRPGQRAARHLALGARAHAGVG